MGILGSLGKDRPFPRLGTLAATTSQKIPSNTFPRVWIRNRRDRSHPIHAPGYGYGIDRRDPIQHIPRVWIRNTWTEVGQSPSDTVKCQEANAAEMCQTWEHPQCSPKTTPWTLGSVLSHHLGWKLNYPTELAL